MEQILKYPRTQHLVGSKLQPGDEDLSQVSLATLRGLSLVVEEKLDGANSAVCFAVNGELMLQSRGHFLTGGYRERHFALLKTWAATHRAQLSKVLGSRYIMYGEWLYAKHTIYYDLLPHFFVEFDVWDREEQCFLDTSRRAALLRPLSTTHAPVLYVGRVEHEGQLRELVQPSLFKSKNWRETLHTEAASQGLDVEAIVRETDVEDLSEGLYVKHEDDGRVQGRYKFVRASFLQTVEQSDSHWLDRPIMANRLDAIVDFYGGVK